MADPTTTNRSLAVPSHGSDVDTWDQPLNANFGLIDTIVGAVSAIAVTGGTTTLTATQLSFGTLSFTGTLTSNAFIVFPDIYGWWSVENLTTGGTNPNPYLLIVQTNTTTQRICIPRGEVVDIQVTTPAVKFRNLGRVGSYLDMATTSVPNWITACTIPPYLNCDGTSFSSSTYPALADFLGGTTLPDLRGRNRSYLNQGTGRITSAGSGIDGNTLFSSGGSQNFILAPSQLPAINLSFFGTAATITSTSTQSYFVASPNGLQGIGANAGTTVNTLAYTGSAIVGVTSTASYTPTGYVALGGSNTPSTLMNPTAIGGITLIRAA